MKDGKTIIIGAMILCGIAMIGLIVLILKGHDGTIAAAFLAICTGLFAAVGIQVKNAFTKGE
jgi:hypothetical protein